MPPCIGECTCSMSTIRLKNSPLVSFGALHTSSYDQGKSVQCNTKAKAFHTGKINIIVIIRRTAVKNIGFVKAESSVIHQLKTNIPLKEFRYCKRCCACSSRGIDMLDGSAVAVSGPSADPRLFPRGGLIGDAVDTSTFRGWRRGLCISLHSG